jgi:hypothetical protein
MVQQHLRSYQLLRTVVKQWIADPPGNARLRLPGQAFSIVVRSAHAAKRGLGRLPPTARHGRVGSPADRDANAFCA